MVEAGAGTGKTGVMVDRYCRLACDDGVALDAILAITFTEKAAAELRQRIRAELLEPRADARLGAGPASCSRELGSAWVTTIHGFCHRLLAAHPVAAGVDPRFRVLDAPEADRAAREAFDEALEACSSRGRRGAGQETVAAYRIDGLRGMVVGAHEELRSRGAAEPRAATAARGPTRPRRSASAGGSRPRPSSRAAGATAADRPLVERALETARRAGARRSASTSDRELRSGGKAKDDAPSYREAVDAAIAAVAEAGEGGVAYDHARRAS